MKHTPEEVIRKAIDYRLAQARVALPGQVQSYDPSTKTVVVTPMVDQTLEADDDTITEQVPTLTGVPVQFPAGGGFYVSMPINTGDTGLIVFSDFSMDYWLQTGQREPAGVDAQGNTISPQDMRAHGPGSAVFIPGVFPTTIPGVAALTINADGSILVGPSPTATDPLVVENKLITFWNALSVSTPMGPSGPPVVPLVTGDVGSLTMKGND